MEIQSPAEWDMAVKEAGAADMLIVAMHEGDLPEEVKKWIVLCLQQRGGHRKTLMVVSKPEVNLHKEVHRKFAAISKALASGGEMDQSKP